MNQEQFLEHFDNYLGFLATRRVSSEKPLFFNVREEFEGNFQNELCGAKQYGIYVYLSETGEVLYIGMALKSSLGSRCWSHLGATNWSNKQFPLDSHQWWDDSEVPKLIRDQIASGRFTIMTIPINPAEYALSIESYLLAVYQQEAPNSELPPLNKKI